MPEICSPFRSKWFKEQVEKEASRDALPLGERIGQVLSIAAGVILIAFFAIHQTRPTGFFTDDFGTAAAAALYTVLIVGMFSPIVRLATNRRNPARLTDALGMAIFAVAGLYLLVLFPFDMTRFAEPLPRALEFLIDWIPEWLAKVFIGIGVVAGAFFAPYTYMMYVSVKDAMAGKGREEPGGTEATQ